MIEWDEAKRRLNLDKHGVDFAGMDGFDWDKAVTREDARGEYGERRFVSVGWIGSRLHVCVWTYREEAFRLISLRKANDRERKRYGQAQELH